MDGLSGSTRETISIFFSLLTDKITYYGTKYKLPPPRRDSKILCAIGAFSKLCGSAGGRLKVPSRKVLKTEAAIVL